MKEVRRRKRALKMEVHSDVVNKMINNCSSHHHQSSHETIVSKSRDQSVVFRIPKKKVQHEKDDIQSKSGLKSPITWPKHRSCQCKICVNGYKSRQLI